MAVVIASAAGIIASWTFIVGWAVFSHHGHAFDRSAVIAMATFIGLVTTLWLLLSLIVRLRARRSQVQNPTPSRPDFVHLSASRM
jgi:hypothetical protein